MRLAFAILFLFGTIAARAQGVAAGYQLSPMDKISIVIAQDPVQGRPIELSVSPLGDLAVPVSRYKLLGLVIKKTVTVNVVVTGVTTVTGGAMDVVDLVMLWVVRVPTVPMRCSDAVFALVASCGVCDACRSGRRTLCEPAGAEGLAGNLRTGTRRLRAGDGTMLQHGC